MNMILENIKSSREAAKILLEQPLLHDIRTTSYRYGIVYVYFDVKRCRFSFQAAQRSDSKGLVKAYRCIDKTDILEVVCCQYSMAQLLIGCMNRKVISRDEFLLLTQHHFEWFAR